MGIEIILYDPSPVVQKIFFHILYHYSPIVHRIDHISKLMEKIQYSKPDIIFIDASFSQDNNLINQINEKKEDLKKIPIILMANNPLNQEVFQSTTAKDFLKKPIEAGKLRELINRFVPKTKSNVLTQHLKFPPIPDFQEGITPKVTSSSEIHSTSSSQKEINTTPDLEQKPIQSDLTASQSPHHSTHIDEDAINPVTASEHIKETQQITSDTLIQSPDHSPGIDEDAINPVTTSEHIKETQQITSDTLIQSPDHSPGIDEDAINPFTISENIENTQQVSSDTLVQSPDHSPNIDDEDAINPVTASEHIEETQQITSSTLIQPPDHSPDANKNDINPATISESTGDTQQISPGIAAQPPPTDTNIDIKPITTIFKNKEKMQQSTSPTENAQTKHKEKKSETNVKILQTFLQSDQSKAIDKNISEEHETTIRNQINKYTKELIDKKIKTEIEKQLMEHIEQNSQKIIHQIVEKAVWQVVPDLAKQLITKELEKLLKEESTEENIEKKSEEEDIYE